MSARCAPRARGTCCLLVALALGAAAAGVPALAAAQASDTAAQDDTAHKHKKAKPPTHFFDTEAPLAVTFTANLSRLRKDKGEKAPWRAATISYQGPNGAPAVVPLTARTRGIWRLHHCDFPPLRFNFAGKATQGTPFEGLDKPKLVSYCQDNDRYERYVLQELQLYRVYALLTPRSHRTRLVRMTYTDSASAKPKTTRWAFILEEPKALASRLGAKEIEEKGAKAEDFHPYSAALVGVFQYLIGNSDWSAAVLHNAEIMSDSTVGLFLVPYDFDFAGAVNTPYAAPDSLLPIKDVRQRIYHGHCASAEDFAKVYALFNEKKGAIYALYADQIGRLLSPSVVKETLAYFDEFYTTINTPRMAKREIADACLQVQ